MAGEEAIFVGIFLMLFSIGVLALFVTVAEWINKKEKLNYKELEKETNLECRFITLEKTLLDRVAEKVNINLKKEVREEDMSQRKEFRKKVYAKMEKELFKEDKKKKA